MDLNPRHAHLSVPDPSYAGRNGYNLALYLSALD